MATSPPAPIALPSRGRLWFGVAAPPLAWAAALMVGYSGAGDGCRHPGVVPGSMAIAGAIWPAAGVLTLAIVTLMALVTAGSSVQRLRHGRSPGMVDPTPAWNARDRAWFMAVTGLGASILFLFGIVMFVIPPLFIHACALRR